MQHPYIAFLNLRVNLLSCIILLIIYVFKNYILNSHKLTVMEKNKRKLMASK